MVENIFPYELPKNWQWSTLGDVARIFTGNSINEKIKHEKYFGKTDGLTYIATKDVGFDNQINYDTNIKIPESENFKVAPKDTALLCIEGGSAGKKMGFTNQPVCFVNKLCAFVSDDIYSKLIYFFMQTEIFLNQFNAKKHGLIGGVSIKNLAEIFIPLPPLDEQKRIVAIIESLFSKLDAAKSIVQKILDGYELRRAAILHKAFTGDLTKNFRADNGLTLDDWQEKKLGEVCQINPPKISTQNLSDDLDVSFFPMASLSEVEGKITKPQIKKLGEVKRGYTNFSEGDVVFAKITPCMENGKSAVIEKLVNDVGFGTTEFFVLRCSESLLNKFLYHLIRGKKFRDETKAVMAGAVGQLRVPKSFLTNYEINLPPLAEQKEIVRVLDSLLDKEHRTKEIAEKILSEIDLLKRTILARAFRGKFGIKATVKKI